MRIRGNIGRSYCRVRGPAIRQKRIVDEPGRHLGGMSSGGLGYTDIGNKYVVRGLALDFYRRLGRHYGKFEQ